MARTAVNKDIFKDLVIPPKPSIVAELQKNTEDTKKVAELISKDPALSAMVLKTVNSPAFALSNKVTSIQGAIILLGLDSVKGLVRAAAVRTAFGKDVAMQMEEFWDSSMDVANVAAVLAAELKCCTRDEAYTLGLFHNSGVPVLCLKFPQYADVIPQAYSTEDIIEAERALMGVDHASVGAYLCKRWNLSEDIVYAVAHHHDGPAFFRKEITPIHIKAALLMLAEHIAELPKTLGKQSKDFQFERMKKSVMAVLGLETEDDLADIKNYALDRAFD